MRTVTLISKDDCSLCDKALNDLTQLQLEIPFHISVRKISPGTEEYDRYKEKIPVILIDGSEICHFRVDAATIRKGLK
jgi:glutaredoxin